MDLDLLEFNSDLLSQAGQHYPHPPPVRIQSFADYCTVTDQIAAAWRKHASERQASGASIPAERYVGEILPWFRGQKNVNHSLTPSLQRFYSKYSSLYDDILTVEEYFQERFIRFARPYLSGISPGDVVEWNYIMRHHEVPSRLLDWTKGSLIGLTYAVHDPAESKEHLKPGASDAASSERDCAVWMLEPRRLMEMATANLLITTNPAGQKGTRNITSQDKKVMALRRLYFGGRFCFTRKPHVRGRCSSGEAFIISIDGQEIVIREREVSGLPIPLIPSHLSRRLESHLSRFTLHPLGSFQKGRYSKLSTPDDDSIINFSTKAFDADKYWYLVKLVIPASLRNEIARSLRMTGISDMNFTQDLDGLAVELKQRFYLGAGDDGFPGLPNRDHC
ncbi:MAG: FRG domain-containing protein [Cyanobacteriota bacterium]